MKKLMNKKLSSIIILTLLLLGMTSILTDIPAVHAQSQVTLFSDGFETGAISAWTGTDTGGCGISPTYAVVASPVHSGTYAFQSYCGSGYMQLYKTFATTYKTLYFLAYVQFATLPTSGKYVTTLWITNSGHTQNIVDAQVINIGGTLFWQLTYSDNSGTHHNNGYSYPNNWRLVSH